MKSASFRASAVPAFLVAFGLTACGGGGSDTVPAQPNATATASAPTPSATAGNAQASASPGAASAPAPTASASASTPPVDISCGEAGFQALVLAELNRRRAAGAVCGTDAYPAAASLGWSDKLAQAAYAHSLDMASNDYFSHTSRNGSTLSQRVDAQAYAWSTVGENIAAGYSGVVTVVQGWMDSPGHCRNIMNAAFSQAGMACSRVTASTYGSYFTLDLGAPR